MQNISFFHRLKIGQRIYIIVVLLLLSICLIGGIGVYKMQIIGHEMEEIAQRDIPLTQILEKITVHQLEQAILMEKALRLKGVSVTSEGETFDDVVKHFEKLAKKTDDEILEAEEMADKMIKETRSDYAKKEFIHVLEELKKLRKSTKSMSITSLTFLKTSEVVRTLNQPLLLMKQEKSPCKLKKNKRS